MAGCDPSRKAIVPEARVVRLSREAVWWQDGFEPLLEWINEELAPATHVGLWGEPDRGIWAWLMWDGVALRDRRPLACRMEPVHLLMLWS